MREDVSNEAFSALNKISDLRAALESQFRQIDSLMQGMIKREDFVNVLFEVTRDHL